MSRTYSLACKACKVHLWVGQTMGPDNPGVRIYSGGEQTDRQVEFLRDHSGHDVVFIENCEALSSLEGDFVAMHADEDEAA